MDEYIPQLTLTPDLSAQAQPEVKKEEDLITKAQAAPCLLYTSPSPRD